jgi:hypothetical protein
MPNIDELSHEMTFTIGGETFEIHDVHPDVLKEWDAEKDPESDEEVLKQLDRQIEAFLAGPSQNGSRAVPEGVKRWRTLRARKDEPIPAWKIVEFHRQLIQTQTRRPTEKPSPSGSGRGPTAASSGAA